MLTILTDPAGALGRNQHPWDFNLSIQDNIAQHLQSGAGCKVLINGIEVDPVEEPRMDATPSVADFVTVIRRPEGFDPFTWVIIAVVASLAVTFALMPKIPGVTSSSAGKDSPNNQLTAQSNIARTYQAIPDVYGYRRVWPDMIQPSTVQYIDQIKYVTEWLCISRGVGTITAVNYAETPIGDIDGASYEVFSPNPSGGYPEHSTTTLSDVIETFESPEVNGQEILPPTPYAVVERVAAVNGAIGASTFTAEYFENTSAFDQMKALAGSGTAVVTFPYGDPVNAFSQTCDILGYTVVGSHVIFTFSCTPWSDAVSDTVSVKVAPVGLASQPIIGPFTLPVTSTRIRWNTVFLRGLKGSVAIWATWWRVDGSGVEIPGTRQSQRDVYSADTYDQQFFTREVIPSGGLGRYRVQFHRETYANGDGSADVAKLEELYAARHYPTKVLPGVTVIRVTTKATNEATGYSERKFNLRWQRHVRSIYGAAVGPSRSFAHAMVHMWVISGNDLNQLDVDKLDQIALQFPLVHDAPLLRFDASLDDADMSLGERMQLAADAARCVMWRDGQKWTVTRDQAKAYPELQLDYRNLDASGDSTISYASHLPASNDGVEVEYVDEATQSKKTYVRLSIASGAVTVGQSANPKKIKLSACTTQAQAENRAQLEARRLLYQRTSVSDKALNDGGSLGIGSLVRWIDPNDFGGDDGLQAGEVMEIAGNLIATSEPIDWKGATSGRILFTGANGAHLGAPVVCTPVGNLVQLASVPAGIYTASADRQLGSRYAFAVGLTSAELESAGLYVTTSLKPDGKGSVSLALIEYDSRIFGGD